MRRRQFIALLGGAAALPLAARAQQARLPTIGLLGAAAPLTQGPRAAAFVQRLRELG
jgi:putative ABC transport system substrate-binding protein